MKGNGRMILAVLLIATLCVPAGFAEEDGDAQVAIESLIPVETPVPDTWACENCGKDNDSAFCRWCGAKKPEPPAAVFCPECGARYDPEAGYLFCGECGAKLPDTAGDALQGKWTVTDVYGTDENKVRYLRGVIERGMIQQYTFDNGKAELYYKEGREESTQTGTYTVDGNRITIRMDGWEFGNTYEFSMEGDTLGINFDDYVLVYTREQPAE